MGRSPSIGAKTKSQGMRLPGPRPGIGRDFTCLPAARTLLPRLSSTDTNPRLRPHCGAETTTSSGSPTSGGRTGVPFFAPPFEVAAGEVDQWATAERCTETPGRWVRSASKNDHELTSSNTASTAERSMEVELPLDGDARAGGKLYLAASAVGAAPSILLRYVAGTAARCRPAERVKLRGFACRRKASIHARPRSNSSRGKVRRHILVAVTVKTNLLLPCTLYNLPLAVKYLSRNLNSKNFNQFGSYYARNNSSLP